MHLDWNAAWQLVLEEKWLPLAIFIVGYLVRLTADDSKFPLSIPQAWQPVVALFLAQLYGLLVAWPNWKPAVQPAMLAALGVMIVKAFYATRPEPAWLKWLAFVWNGKKNPPPPPPAPPAAA
jgi:hypothetical protein